MTQLVMAATDWLNISSLFDWVADVRRSWDYQKQIRQTEKELARLSDRELNDIGIARGDIYAIARGDITTKRGVEVSENQNLKGWV